MCFAQLGKVSKVLGLVVTTHSSLHEGAALVPEGHPNRAALWAARGRKPVDAGVLAGHAADTGDHLG